jgi:hypothetical protein
VPTNEPLTRGVDVPMYDPCPHIALRYLHLRPSQILASEYFTFGVPLLAVAPSLVHPLSFIGSMCAEYTCPTYHLTGLTSCAPRLRAFSRYSSLLINGPRNVTSIICTYIHFDPRPCTIMLCTECVVYEPFVASRPHFTDPRSAVGYYTTSGLPRD